MNPLNEQILSAIPSPPQQKSEWDDFLPPVEGKMGGGFTAHRAHGQHNGGDIHASPGTPIIAPQNMAFKYGKQGGSNLRNNDYWAHFDELDSSGQPTGRELRFAHMSGVPNLKPGDVVKRGEQWSTVGNVIDNPHVHMSVYDNNKGHSVDWPSALGLTQGQTAIATGSNPSLEKKVNSIAATIPTLSREGESIPFDQGGKSYMDPTMLAKGGFGASIPGLDTGDLQAGIDAGANTQPGLMQQILGALGGAGKDAGLVGNAINTIGSVATLPLDIAMLLKTDKMARQHAGWLQNVAANPPRPGWARSMSGPGMNS